MIPLPPNWDVDAEGFAYQKYKVEKADRIVREFTSFGEEGDRYLQMVSSLHTTRLAAWGFTVEADLMGIEYYQINEQLDSKICPVCEVMHGRTFPVNEARSALEQILLVDDNPEVIKAVQPWPKQNKVAVARMASMSTEDLISANWHLPPFHPNCRGQLVAVGDIADLEDLPSTRAAAAGADPTQQINRNMLRDMGIDLGIDGSEFYVKHIGIDPASMVSALLGELPMEYMALLEGYGKEAPLRLRAYLNTERPSMAFSINHPVYGTQGNVQAKFRYYPLERAIQITEFSAPKGTDMPKVLDSWFQFWKRLSTRFVGVNPKLPAQIAEQLLSYLNQRGMTATTVNNADN